MLVCILFFEYLLKDFDFPCCYNANCKDRLGSRKFRDEGFSVIVGCCALSLGTNVLATDNPYTYYSYVTHVDDELIGTGTAGS